MRLSSPDKVLWPQAAGGPGGPGSGLTKRHLRDYLIAASDRLLPQLRDRPLSVKRFPRGVEAEGFFVKDTPDHAPEAIGRWREWAHSAKREVAYSLVDDVDGLAWMAQQNSVEFHTALLRIDRPDRSDQLVFDVDPPASGEPRVEVAPGVVANWTRDVLVELGLDPLVKTSGGRGLHVIVPIERRYGPDLLRPLTLGIARMVADRHPAELTVEMRKDDRGGRTLIDWSRSGPSTLIAAWSPRAHPLATVATPLDWSEVDADLDPTAFTLNTVLDRDDPWQDAPRPARLEPVVRAVEDAGIRLVDASPPG